MATRRITALTTTDADLEAIRAIGKDTQVAGRIVVCDIDEEQIPRLEERGVMVQAVERKQLPEVGALAPPPLPMFARLPDRFAAPREEAIAVLRADIEPAPTDVYVLTINGPLLPAWREALAAAGAELLERVESGDYTARIAAEHVPAVRELTFLNDLRLFAPADTLNPTELAAHVTPPQAGAEEVTFEAYLHPGNDPRTVVAWLHDRAVDVAGSGRRKVRFFALRGSTLIAELSRLPEVAAVEEFVPPRPANDRARVLLGIEKGRNVGGNGGPSGRTGKGQVIAVADTGIAEDHPDFSGRIRSVIALGRPNDASDPDGHGTHVAGSALGNGSASDGAIKGTAPDAELVFQSVLDARGELSGLGVDLGDLFDQAYAAGARIHNNSWGAVAGSAYRINSLEVDSYVYEHPEMLIVIAAGNSGTAVPPPPEPEALPLPSPKMEPGFVGLLSVDAPGTAKNALTVGASRSDRHVDGDETWGAWWPEKYPDPPIAAAKVSGDAEALAAFSGRGPCDEQIRMKPDLVAPGTFILSTRSPIAPTKEFWAEHPDNKAYAFMGGTSMAAPIVAGCAALVRQYFVDERGHAPSAALVKAVLINGTRWLSGADAVADHPSEPNYHQGFGCVNMPTTIPATDAEFRVAFRDIEIDASESLADTGAAAQYLINVGPGELRLCLAWTDPPGRGLQNTIALVLEHTNTGERWFGNPTRPPGVVGWDSGNNVQVIRVPEAAAGAYRVSLIAANLLVTPQAFALVVTGQLDSELASI